MPTYKFTCKKCSAVYEELTSYDKTEKYKDVKCPQCNSKRKERNYSYGVAITFGNPKESSKWDSFSYRAGYNMEKAKGERREAAKRSHMGADPYNTPRLKD